MSVEIQCNGLLVIVEVVGHIIKERSLYGFVIIVYESFRAPNVNLGWNFKAAFDALKIESESFVIEQRLKSLLGLTVGSAFDQSDNLLADLEFDKPQAVRDLRGNLIQTLGYS